MCCLKSFREDFEKSPDADVVFENVEMIRNTETMNLLIVENLREDDDDDEGGMMCMYTLKY